MIILREKTFASNIIKHRQKILNLEEKYNKKILEGLHPSSPEMIKLRMKIDDNKIIYHNKLEGKSKLKALKDDFKADKKILGNKRNHGRLTTIEQGTDREAKEVGKGMADLEYFNNTISPKRVDISNNTNYLEVTPGGVGEQMGPFGIKGSDLDRYSDKQINEIRDYYDIKGNILRSKDNRHVPENLRGSFVDHHERGHNIRDNEGKAEEIFMDYIYGKGKGKAKIEERKKNKALVKYKAEYDKETDPREYRLANYKDTSAGKNFGGKFGYGAYKSGGRGETIELIEEARADVNAAKSLGIREEDALKQLRLHQHNSFDSIIPYTPNRNSWLDNIRTGKAKEAFQTQLELKKSELESELSKLEDATKSTKKTKPYKKASKTNKSQGGNKTNTPPPSNPNSYLPPVPKDLNLRPSGGGGGGAGGSGSLNTSKNTSVNSKINNQKTGSSSVSDEAKIAALAAGALGAGAVGGTIMFDEDLGSNPRYGANPKIPGGVAKL